MAVGGFIIGIFAWPLAATEEPFMPIFILSGSNAIMLAAVAAVTGFIAYFAAWPFGKDIGILAVPTGLVVWMIRSGSLADYFKANPSIAQRQELYSSSAWHPIFWLAIIAIGFAGVIIAHSITGGKKEGQEKKLNLNSILNSAAAVLASAVIAFILTNVFAQDVKLSDQALGSVVAQPAVGQIILGVMLAFGIAAFAVKVFLNASYIWPVISAVLVTLYAARTYTNQQVVEQLVMNWPPIFFNNPAAAILPMQMIALAALGSVAGYWWAISFLHWKKHTI